MQAPANARMRMQFALLTHYMRMVFALLSLFHQVVRQEGAEARSPTNKAEQLQWRLDLRLELEPLSVWRVETRAQNEWQLALSIFTSIAAFLGSLKSFHAFVLEPAVKKCAARCMQLHITSCTSFHVFTTCPPQYM